MSNQQNDQIMEAKLEAYEEYLANLSHELLVDEFNRVFGCNPEDYFSNANNYTNYDFWCDKLVEEYAIKLHDNPEALWTPKKEIQSIEKQTKQIKAIIEEIKSL